VTHDVTHVTVTHVTCSEAISREIMNSPKKEGGDCGIACIIGMCRVYAYIQSCFIRMCLVYMHPIIGMCRVYMCINRASFACVGATHAFVCFCALALALALVLAPRALQ